MLGPAGYMVGGPAGYMLGPAGFIVAHVILVSPQSQLTLDFDLRLHFDGFQFSVFEV